MAGSFGGAPTGRRRVAVVAAAVGVVVVVVGVGLALAAGGGLDGVLRNAGVRSATSDDGPTAPEGAVGEPDDGGQDPADATAGTGDDGSAVADLAPDAAVDHDPVFTAGPCLFDYPVGPGVDGPTCGTVRVPADWRTGDGEVALAVAVFAAPAEATGEPVVYLDGGPGSTTLDTAGFLADDLIEPLRTDRDVVLFDQRGVGLSTPPMTCDEVTEATRVSEDDPDGDDDAATDRFLDSLRTCSKRLQADGVDLSTFSSVTSAHDVDAIRRALGYEQWNLHGISYGTRLALEVLRVHPTGVRSAVIDSVLPPQVDAARDNPATFVASYEAVVEACAAEPACAAGGDLADRLATQAADLERRPVLVEVVDYSTGEVDDVYVDGSALVGLVIGALYDPWWFTDLPELVTDLEAGRTDALSTYLSLDRTNERFLSVGLLFAVDCNEEIAHSDPVDTSAAVPDDPFGLRPGFDYSSNLGPAAFDSCAAFGTGGAAGPVATAAEADDPVESDVPTLVLAGRFDPITPPSWAELAASTLENSHLVVVEGESHGVSTGPCGTSVVAAFLAEPDVAPDASCYDEVEVRFVGAPADGPELETVDLDPGLGRAATVVRPVDWFHGDLPGDSYRQASILDETQLLQVAGSRSVGTALETYLIDAFGLRLVDDGTVTRGDREWTRRAASSDTIAAEWYETRIGTALAVVVLVTGTDEMVGQRRDVLLPALDGFEVGDG